MSSESTEGVYPWTIVACSSTTYVLLFNLMKSSSLDEDYLRTLIKGISSFHATFMTLSSSLVLIFGDWPVLGISGPPSNQGIRSDYMNDDQNPLIWGRSAVANTLTSIETGYLIYDTIALLHVSYSRKPSDGLVAALTRLARKAPIFLGHHIALIGALGCLQSYIASGEERGLWIIVAFLTMNASNPLLHLRWMMKKKYGKDSRAISAALIVVFAWSRFGCLWWTLKRYAMHHDLPIWTAFLKQRLICKSGTAALTAVNSVWFCALVKQSFFEHRTFTKSVP